MSDEQGIQFLEIEGHTIGVDIVDDMLMIYRPPAEEFAEPVLLSQVFIGTLVPLVENYLEPEEVIELPEQLELPTGE